METEQKSEEKWDHQESILTKLVTSLGSGWGFALAIIAPSTWAVSVYLYGTSSLFASTPIEERDTFLFGIRVSVILINLMGLLICGLEYKKGAPTKSYFLPLVGAAIHGVFMTALIEY